MPIGSMLRMAGPATGLVALLLAGPPPTSDPHPPEGAKLDHHGRPATHGWAGVNRQDFSSSPMSIAPSSAAVPRATPSARRSNP